MAVNAAIHSVLQSLAVLKGTCSSGSHLRRFTRDPTAAAVAAVGNTRVVQVNDTAAFTPPSLHVGQ